jgi:hypothetical protein
VRQALSATEKRYIGPADTGEGGRTLSGRSPAQRLRRRGHATADLLPRQPRRARRRARAERGGHFGPGFYLTSHARATLYARYDARIAAKIGQGEEGWAGEPRHDGRVYAFDVSGLTLKVLKHERYQLMCMALDPLGAPTPTAKAELQKLLAAEGYDGLYILDEERHEMVVFPGSMNKIKVVQS